MVEKISNDKGESFKLRKLLFKRKVTVTGAIALVEETIQNLLSIGIPASDFNIDNFILDGKLKDHKIFMVDGFSPKKPNFKIYLLLKSKILY